MNYNIQNYEDAVKFINGKNILKNNNFIYYRNYNGPNYIPVKNYKDFEADVYLYYNQYYASPWVTQQRRIMRNYINNNNSIKKSNKNPFFNNKNRKFNFIYGEGETYMIIENSNKSIEIYIWINNGWCLQKNLNKINCKVLENIIKNYAVKNY
jgi:hypothetical protein